MINNLYGKTILVTGATGLIGKTLIKGLLSCEGINVIAFVRDEKKAEQIFDASEHLEIVAGDIRNYDFNSIKSRIDYIVHAASETSSKSFVKSPVDVINTAISGTLNVLEFARTCNPAKVVFLSSMEVYGAPKTDEKIYETACNNIDTMETRSSYPESKRMCESMCRSYYSQYGVNTVVLRLTQTFGEGVDYNDTRVFAEFARCVIENKDIVLKTKGETMRSYLHVDDAVNAIVCALCDGKPGEAYNVANEETYCSIYDMACIVIKEYGNGASVKIEETDTSGSGYAKTLHMNLDTTKIRSLGWKPRYGLLDMYKDMIEYMTTSI